MIDKYTTNTMNFEQLRSIVKNVKTRIPCPHCEANYMNESIHVVGVQQDKCIFILKCHECTSPILVTATLASHEIIPKNQEELLEIINKNLDYEEQGIAPTVQIDDVIDMHEFLQEFSGDFTHLFEKVTPSQK